MSVHDERELDLPGQDLLKGAEESVRNVVGLTKRLTALSLLAWYVFAPQCISTLAIVKRETNSIRYPLLMAAYLFTLAYVAAFITYRVTLMFTGT